MIGTPRRPLQAPAPASATTGPTADVDLLARAIARELRRDPPPPRLAVTESEAAEMLGCSSRTVFSLRQCGLLKAFTLETGNGKGRNPSVRYAVAEIERFIREREAACAASSAAPDADDATCGAPPEWTAPGIPADYTNGSRPEGNRSPK